MARTKDDSDLKSRSSCAKLPKRKAPYWMSMEKGRRLGYYKGAKGGNWLAWFYDPTADPPTIQKALGAADDFSEPDGKMVLSFSQARKLHGNSSKRPITRPRGNGSPRGHTP